MSPPDTRWFRDVTCAVSNMARSTKNHHTPEGFRNNYVAFVTNSLGDILFEFALLGQRGAIYLSGASSA